MKVTYHGQKGTGWCPLLMTNTNVIRVRGLDPFSGEVRNLGNSASQSQWCLWYFGKGRLFRLRAGILPLTVNRAKLRSQYNQRVVGTITASQNSVLVHVGTSVLAKRTCSHETLLEDWGALGVGEKQSLNSIDPRFYHGANVLRTVRR